MAVEARTVERVESVRVFVSVCDTCGKEAETSDPHYFGDPALVYPPCGWIIAGRIGTDGIAANRVVVCSTVCLEDALPSLNRLNVPLVSESA